MTAGWNLQWATRSTAPKKVIVIPDGTLPFPRRRHMFGSSHVCRLEVDKERSIAVTDHRCRQGAHEDVTGAACSHDDGPETRREPACGGERRRKVVDGDAAHILRLD